MANGIQVLYGNLAPEGTLVKTSAVPADQHTFDGPAMCFNSEEECFDAYNKHEIPAGTAVIIRYEGPVGGPGMKELHRVTEIMKGIPGLRRHHRRSLLRCFGRSLRGLPVPRGR